MNSFIEKIISRRLFLFIFILVLVFVAYGQAIWFDFTGLDEDDHIIDRQYFLKNPSVFFETFKHNGYYPTGFAAYYRPIQTISFAVDSMIAGIKPFFYHLINLIFHSLAVFILFLVLQNLGYNKRLSLFFVSIFAVHPALRQAVVWVPGRNDLLLAIFALVSFLYFLKFIDSNKKLHLFFQVLFFALALFTKETTIALPFIFLAYLFIFKKNISKFYFLVLLGLWIAVIGGWFGLRWFALREVSSEASLAKMVLGSFKYLSGFFVYLGKAILPFKLSVLAVLDKFNLAVGAAVLGMAAYYFIFKTRNLLRPALFGILWFLLFLLPTFITNEPQSRVVFLENRLYLPLIGVLIILMQIPWQNYLKNKLRLILPLAIIILLSVLTVTGIGILKNRLNFWQSAVKASPNLARAHTGLGRVYTSQNKLDEALSEHQIAKNLAPDEKRISNNIGVVYLRKKMLAEAEQAFKREIALNPMYASAYNNLAFTYAVQNRNQEAEEFWLAAEAINFWYVLPHQGLAIIYAQQGKYRESVEHINHIFDLGVDPIPDLKKILLFYNSGKIIR